MKLLTLATVLAATAIFVSPRDTDEMKVVNVGPWPVVQAA